MIKRVLPWLALGILVAGVLVVVLWPGDATTPAERAHSIAAGLKCQECQGLSVADSNASTSSAIRADIKRRIAAGESDGEIRQYFVDKYGETILLEPQSTGISLIVWVLPVVVIAAGALGIVFALARNRREPRLHATDADEALVGREREREASE
ncbi:MAG: cytochrome c-type biogenesis protein CcmH [Acidimicrobiia bacterium]